MNKEYLLYKQNKEKYDQNKEKYECEISIRENNISDLQKEINFYESEYNRIDCTMSNIDTILRDLSLDFRNNSVLNTTDYAFMFFAISLHCLRYIFQPKINPSFEKISTNNRHSAIEDGTKEFRYSKQEINKYSDIKRSRKFPNTSEIFLNPVPYDAMRGTEKIFIDGVTPVGKNISGVNHHVATLGHNPILGYFFGTLNILTSTITFNKITLDSNIVRHVRGMPKSQYVDNPIGFPEVVTRSIESISEDNDRLKAAVTRQFIHMQSDKYTKLGLPIPFVSASTAQQLLEKGWNSNELERLLKYTASNMITIGTQVTLSILINSIIEVLYRLIESDDNEHIREIKCRKIIDYSNVITSCSNIIYSLVMQDLSNLDIGGFLVTIYRICTNPKIINQIRDEFVYGSFEKQLILREYKKEEIC